MVCEETTPRRQRKSWVIPRTEDRVSVKTVLHAAFHDTSLVLSEASTPRKLDSRDCEEQEPQRRNTPRGVAWDVSIRDSCSSRPDTSVVSSCKQERKRSQMHHRRNNRAPQMDNRSSTRTLPVTNGGGGGGGVRRNGVIASTMKPEDTIAKLKALRPKQHQDVHRNTESKTTNYEQYTNTRSKGSVAKDSLKRIMSGSRARNKVLKSRSETFTQTIELLNTSSSMFRRAKDPEEGLESTRHPEEICVIEVQQAAFDRWEKAVLVARQALEEAMEAEKVLSFAAEFEHMKESLESSQEDWDVGVDKYLNLYRTLQSEYPETAPIKPSRIQRHKRRTSLVLGRIKHRETAKSTVSARSDGGSTAELNNSSERKESSIPSRSQDVSTEAQFNVNVTRLLGRRFAHAAECWFLRLINRLVGTDFQPSVYCREDCYFLMESLRKVQNWLLHAKGRSRIDRNEGLLIKLRETIIQWSSKMIRLPPAKTVVH
eukprot:g7580.t1